jgi:hypothetical protein
MSKRTSLIKKWFEPAVSPLYVVLAGAICMGLYTGLYTVKGKGKFFLLFYFHIYFFLVLFCNLILKKERKKERKKRREIKSLKSNKRYPTLQKKKVGMGKRGPQFTPSSLLHDR